MTEETELQTRLRKVGEDLDRARAKEDELRRELAEAVETRKRLKAKHEELFVAEEWAEHKRRKEDYRHATK